MKNNRDNEPLWCKMYRDRVIRPAQRQRITEQKGRTKESQSGFYLTRQWLAIRDRRRRDNPLCQACEEKGFVTVGRVIDHIIPIDEDPSLALEYNNTQNLCHSCHSWKTAQDKKRKDKADKLRRGRKLMKDLENKPTGGG